MPDRALQDFSSILEAFYQEWPAAIGPGIVESAARLKREILINLNGRVLDRRSGALYRSVEVRPETRSVDPGIEITAGGPSVPYAAIHEYGGKAGKSLLTYIPSRPYISPAVESAVEGDLSEALIEGITEALIYGGRRSNG